MKLESSFKRVERPFDSTSRVVGILESSTHQLMQHDADIVKSNAMIDYLMERVRNLEMMVAGLLEREHQREKINEK